MSNNAERQTRRYLRKRDLRLRYGYKSDRSIERACGDGRLPKPDMYLKRFPLWLESALDEFDNKATRAHRQKGRRR